MANRHVVFSHGSGGSTRSAKIAALAQTARVEGYSVVAVDYGKEDRPKERIAMLCDACQPLQGEVVLVGASLGGYVSLAVASLLHAKAVFLMAPAIYVADLPPLRESKFEFPISLVHGWHDTVIPVEHSIRFAREHNAPLQVLNTDHRMHDQLPVIRHFFEHFIISIDLR